MVWFRKVYVMKPLCRHFTQRQQPHAVQHGFVSHKDSLLGCVTRGKGMTKVSSLVVYPVKGCQGVQVDEALVLPTGDKVAEPSSSLLYCHQKRLQLQCTVHL